MEFKTIKILLTIMLKVKYLGTNISKFLHDIFSENSEILMRAIINNHL